MTRVLGWRDAVANQRWFRFRCRLPRSATNRQKRHEDRLVRHNCRLACLAGDSLRREIEQIAAITFAAVGVTLALFGGVPSHDREALCHVAGRPGVVAVYGAVLHLRPVDSASRPWPWRAVRAARGRRIDRHQFGARARTPPDRSLEADRSSRSSRAGANGNRRPARTGRGHDGARAATGSPSHHPSSITPHHRSVLSPPAWAP